MGAGDGWRGKRCSGWVRRRMVHPLLFYTSKVRLRISRILLAVQWQSVLEFRNRMFFGLPDPNPLVRGMDPDPDPSLFSWRCWADWNNAWKIKILTRRRVVHPLLFYTSKVRLGNILLAEPLLQVQSVLGIRIRKFLGLPGPGPLVTGADPDPDPSFFT